ncbi:MAG: DUF2240 family protein [Promethearchaeota archaeon]
MPDLSNIQTILKSVYLSLGKEQIIEQDLIFFIAFDLKLFPPSKVETLLKVGKSRGFLEKKENKIIFIVDKLMQSSGSSPNLDMINIIKKFSRDDQISKAYGISDKFVIEASFNSETLQISGTILTPSDGKEIHVKIDPKEKLILQEFIENKEEDIKSGIFYKYLVKILLKFKNDIEVVEILNDMNRNINEWKFKNVFLKK